MVRSVLDESFQGPSSLQLPRPWRRQAPGHYHLHLRSSAHVLIPVTCVHTHKVLTGTAQVMWGPYCCHWEVQCDWVHLLLLLVVGNINVYCCQGSCAVPACPYGKRRLVGCKTFGSDEGRVIGICLLGVCSRTERLSAGAEVSIWRAEFRRHFGSGVRAVFGICKRDRVYPHPRTYGDGRKGVS
jgi:hypothetical protein